MKLPGKEYEWYITNSKLFRPRDCIISFINPLDFNNSICDILDDNLYFRNKITAYDKITRREKEVIKLFVREKSLKEIAKQLNISELTVKTHRQNIYKKLGVNSITELFRFASIFLLE